MRTLKTTPTVTFVVPCFNSAKYMDHCLSSLVIGEADVEVVIVDDGSTLDDTAAKADQWQAEHPDIVKVIHQSNKGHGGAVMAGLGVATGAYMIVVDSDDWLDRDALHLLLFKLREFVASGKPVDLVVTNYVYEHASSGTRKAIRFRGPLPVNRRFGWAQTGFFGPGQNIMIHAAVYRTQVLRDANLDLPEHTFYVDNIYVYVPLPYVRTLYYLPVDLYRYFIGRDDQSVNRKVLLTRVDQQMHVTKVMVDRVKLPDDVPEPKLAKYMTDYLGLIVTASCIVAIVSNKPEDLAQRRDLWDYIEAKDPALAKRLHKQPLVIGTNLPGRGGRAIARAGYHIAQTLYRFN